MWVYIDAYRCVGELRESDCWLLSKLLFRTSASWQISDGIKLLMGNYTGEYILLLQIWVCSLEKKKDALSNVCGAPLQAGLEADGSPVGI